MDYTIYYFHTPVLENLVHILINNNPNIRYICIEENLNTIDNLDFEKKCGLLIADFTEIYLLDHGAGHGRNISNDIEQEIKVRLNICVKFLSNNKPCFFFKTKIHSDTPEFFRFPYFDNELFVRNIYFFYPPILCNSYLGHYTWQLNFPKASKTVLYQNQYIQTPVFNSDKTFLFQRNLNRQDLFDYYKLDIKKKLIIYYPTKLSRIADYQDYLKENRFSEYKSIYRKDGTINFAIVYNFFLNGDQQKKYFYTDLLFINNIKNFVKILDKLGYQLLIHLHPGDWSYIDPNQANTLKNYISNWGDFGFPSAANPGKINDYEEKLQNIYLVNPQHSTISKEYSEFNIYSSSTYAKYNTCLTPSLFLDTKIKKYNWKTAETEFHTLIDNTNINIDDIYFGKYIYIEDFLNDMETMLHEFVNSTYEVPHYFKDNHPYYINTNIDKYGFAKILSENIKKILNKY